MKNLLIVSTSTVHGQAYLAYMQGEINDFFHQKKRILFVPYARPSGISHDAYTQKAALFFEPQGYDLRGAHTFENAKAATDWAEGIFTGGGNTFLLLKTLYETGLFNAIDDKVQQGMPYMGTSAGANITGVSIGTTNDMPIVYPPTYHAFGWVPFNINAHYLDPLPNSTHMGETRETRIAEFHHYNDQPVIGLREGSWLQVQGSQIKLCGNQTARLFTKAAMPVELEPGVLSDLN